MDLYVHQPIRRSPRAFLARLAVLALMITPAAPHLHAHSASDDAVPPAYPDSIHLLRGCHLSTVAYLARFQAAFPHEQGGMLFVELREFQGQHTIAVVSWRGAWWGRDEFFGVFTLNVSTARESNLENLTSAATTALARHAQSEVRHGRGNYATPPPERLPMTERAQQVFQAAALLPGASEFFWVGDGRDEIPMLFFRPMPGWISVYEPLAGTASAECEASNPAAIVKAVAARLGYRVDHVRRDFNRVGSPTMTARVAVRETPEP